MACSLTAVVRKNPNTTVGMDDDLLGVNENGQDAGASSSSIVARLEALRRDARGVSGPSTAALPLATVDYNQPRQPTAEAGTVDDPKPAESLTALAAELFGDERFRAACAKGLNARLQRTRDGATAESRISELAGKS